MALFVTANVGTLFEQVDDLMDLWVNALLKKIEERRPSFVVVHFQEVGGKNYRESMPYVDCLITSLSVAVPQYTRRWHHFDRSFELPQQFTALGVYIFALPELPLEFYNFSSKSFVACDEIPQELVYDVHFKRERFPERLNPVVWTRKGYLWIHARIGSQEFDIVNVHLFHDDSNIAAAEKSPSQFCEARLRALKYVLEKTYSGSFKNLFFIFGDMNFRVDLHKFFKNLEEQGATSHSADGRFHILDKTAQPIVTMESKKFAFASYDVFKTNPMHLKPFDERIPSEECGMWELPITFPASYAYEEHVDHPHTFLKKRCPSWCDRVMFSAATAGVVAGGIYELIGYDVCMGDHKPVSLYFKI